MKTIPVSLILAGILSPSAILAQSPGDPGPKGPPRDGEGRKNFQRAFMEAWKAADKNQDGSLSPEEFAAMSRIQNLPEEKRANLFKRLDKSGDGLLSREEIGKLGRPHDNPGPPMQRLWELDTDKSGGVTFDEFKVGRVFSKLPPEKQDGVFRRLDTNKDGIISPNDRPEPPKRPEGGKGRPNRPGRPDRPDGGRPDPSRMEPKQLIRQLDANADGSLSFEEFRTDPMVCDLSEDEQEDRFEKMDRNQDLKLSAEDFPPPAPHEGGGRPPGEMPPAEGQ